MPAGDAGLEQGSVTLLPDTYSALQAVVTAARWVITEARRAEHARRGKSCIWRGLIDALAALDKAQAAQPRRAIVCLLGRRKDWRLLRQAEVQETLAGRIVLTVGCIGPDGPEVIHDAAMVQACQQTHFDKIRMADEVLHVHAGAVGEDTQRDLDFARSLGKVVRECNPEGAQPEGEPQ